MAGENGVGWEAWLVGREWMREGSGGRIGFFICSFIYIQFKTVFVGISK